MARQKKEKIELDLEIYTKSGKIRKRKPKRSRNYFTAETDEAIVKYNNSIDDAERNYLFEKYINYSLHKLAENIINTYKFEYWDVENIEDLKHELVVFMHDKLAGYKPHKGKGYSYFTKITYHYMITYNDINYKKLKAKADLEEVDDNKQIFMDIQKQNDSNELIYIVDAYIKYVEENIESLFKDEQSRDLVENILTIFKRRETLDVFHRQVFFKYMKELTNQSTAKISKVVKKMKEIYQEQLNVFYLHGDLDIQHDDIYNI